MQALAEFFALISLFFRILANTRVFGTNLLVLLIGFCVAGILVDAWMRAMTGGADDD